jgi:hypothetical protein
MVIRVKPGSIRHQTESHKGVKTSQWNLAKQKARYERCSQHSRKPDKLKRVFNDELGQPSEALNRLDQEDL